MTKQASKPTGKAAVEKFEPSTGEEDYLNPPTKAGKAVIKKALEGGANPLVTNKAPLAKNAQLERALPVMADEINHAYEQAELMRRTTCSAFIEVGRLLNIARTQFSSAPKFQTWRKKMIHFSNSHVQRLMSVAKEFGDNEDAALLPFGTLAVLTNAADEVKDKVVADAKDGKTTTRAEATDMKKEAQAKDDPPEGETTAESMEQGMEESKDDLIPVTEPAMEEWEEAQITLDMTFERRAAIVQVEGARNPFHAACLLYGIPPFHDGHPSGDLVSHLYFSHSDKVEKNDPDNTDLLDKLTEAHDILQSVIKLA